MENVILIVLLAAIAGGIIAFLIRAKKQGRSCMGCAHAKQCSGKCSTTCLENK